MGIEMMRAFGKQSRTEIDSGRVSIGGCVMMEIKMGEEASEEGLQHRRALIEKNNFLGLVLLLLLLFLFFFCLGFIRSLKNRAIYQHDRRINMHFHQQMNITSLHFTCERQMTNHV